jgi:hypothetical protein
VDDGLAHASAHDVGAGVVGKDHVVVE